MKARAGSAYISCSGRIGSAIAEAVAIRTEHLGQHADERRRERLVRRLIERRERQRLPQPVRQLRRSDRASRSHCDTVMSPSAATRPVRASSRRAAAATGAIRRTDSRSRHDSASHLSTAPSRCSGGGSARTLEHRARARSDPDTARSAPPAAGRCRSAPIASQKRERLRVAAEQHVLPVVDELAGDAIAERRRPSAELRPRLEHEHAAAGVGQRGRGRQPGEAAADDDDVGRHRMEASDGVGGGHARAAMPEQYVESRSTAAMTARRGRGTRTTSEKTS